MFKQLLAILALFVSLTVYAVSSKNGKTIKNIGWIDGKCLVIKNSKISLPQQITIITLEKINKFTVGTIYKKVTTEKDCAPLSSDRRKVNDGNGNNFYLVKTNSAINLAIGVFSIDKVKQLKYSFCATSEGISFSVKKNASLIWEGYYYLGYDIEENCSTQ